MSTPLHGYGLVYAAITEARRAPAEVLPLRRTRPQQAALHGYSLVFASLTEHCLRQATLAA